MYSLRSKMFLLIVFILALVATGIMFFSKRDVEQAMVSAEERSQQNVLHLIDLTIQGRYTALLWEKAESIKRVKNIVQHLSGMVFKGLTPYLTLQKDGLLDTERAQAMALSWVASLESEGVYCFVYDRDNRALFHPRKELVGQELSSIRDIKGRVMVDAAREEAERYGNSFSTFTHHGPSGEEMVKQYAYFVTVPEWGWVVATAAFVGDVEEQLAQKQREIIQVLRENMAKVRFAETGFVFIFNGDKEIIVSPSEEIAAALSKGSAANVPLLDALMATALDEAPDPLEYTLSDAQGQRLSLVSYVVYFKPLDWYIGTVADKNEIAGPANDLLTRQSYVFGAVFVVGLLVALVFAARLAGPLARLTNYAMVMPEQDFTQAAPAESPIQDLPRHFRDEVGRLAQSFIFMEGSLRENIHNLMQVTAAKQRIESELSIARDIQMGLLPKIFPAFPDRTEFDLYAFLQPAKEVGGDLYDFFFIDEHRLCFTVGDVSDKGVPAALFMAVTKTLIKVVSEHTDDPAEMVSVVNNELAHDNPNAMFVTLIIAILDLRTGKVVFANAGHNRPVIFNRDGIAFVKGISGPMAGAMPNLPFTPLETALAPGDMLLLYSDGVTEAMNEQDQLFSDQQLLQTATELRDRAPQALIEGILDRVHLHVGQAKQSDDITMLCVRYNGPA